MDSKAANIQWHPAEVTKADRTRARGHRPAAIWLTGLSGSGKSTIAHRLERLLLERGCFVYALDGDNLRHGLCSDLDMSSEGRRENIRRVGEVTKLFVDAGAIVLTAFISPFRDDRAAVRRLLGADEFIEVYVSTPLDVCEQRDPKGLYKRARQGEIAQFTGLSAPYEPPESPEVTLDTSHDDLGSSCARVLDYLIHRQVVSP